MSALDLFLQYEFLQRAALAGLLVALLCAALGVFLVLRNLSLLGDGLAHISFGGVAIGLAAGLYPLGVALVFAVAGAILVHVLRERRVVKGDTAIGILFTSGLALGILVVSATGGFSVNADSYLFGNILAIETTDLWVIAAVGAAILLLLALFQREFFYMTFSEEAARISGLPVHALNLLFVGVTAAAIVVASRIVGVLLVSALLIVPAASALQVSRSFRAAILTSVLFGLASVAIGLYVAVDRGYATGATVAITSTVLFALTVLGKRAFTARAAS